MDKILEKNPQIKSRLLYFLDYKGIRKTDFSKQTGISYSNIKGDAQKSELGGEQISKILETYSELNPEWFLLGIGDMLRNSPIRDQNFAHGMARNIDDNTTRDYIVPDSPRLDNDITRGLIASIQSLTHAIEKLTDKLCDL